MLQEQTSAGFQPSAGRQPLKTRIRPENELEPSRPSVNAGPQRNGRKRIRNVGEAERVTSVAAGSILILLGLARRSVPGLLVGAAGAALAYRGATGHCALYESLNLDTSAGATAPDRNFDVSQCFTINAPPERLYSFCRDLQHLPQILTHVESVSVLDSKRSHWVLRPGGPLTGTLEWDSEITREEPNRLIAWQSIPGSSVDTSGEITFQKAIGDRGTAVRISMRYHPPGGQATLALAKLFGKSPKGRLREDLRNLKRLIELGEIPTTKGQTRGTCAGKSARNAA